MVDADNIVRAIAAHAKWKYHLRQAIRTGTSSWTVNGTRLGDQCAFGQWLRDLPASDRASEHCQVVSARHAEFHHAAADVLALALSGQRAAAEAAIEIGSPFSEVSKHLTLAMMAWQRDLAAHAVA